MTAIERVEVQARRAGFFWNVVAVSSRALRSVARDPETVVPALVVPVFFFAVNIGALQDLVEQGGIVDFKAFQLPVALLFAVTGISRAVTLVLDIQSGYFDRLAMTPVRRLALLLGLMVADVALVIAMSIPVLIMGFAVGVRFETGVPGVFAFVGIAALWSLVYAGFPYAIALKTGNPAAVNTSFIIFFPFIFPDTDLHPHRGHDRLDGDHGDVQSRHLPARLAALHRQRRLGDGRDRQGPHLRRRGRSRQLYAGPPGAAGARHPPVGAIPPAGVLVEAARHLPVSVTWPLMSSAARAA